VLPGLPGGPGVDEQPLEISDEVLDALLAGASAAQEIAGPDGLLGQLTRRLLNRALEAELTEHLGYEPDQAPPGGVGNARNGKPSKTILTDQGPLRIRSPRDRTGTFEPQIVKKRRTRWVGFDDRVISLNARGLTVREIQGHLAEIYGTEVSPDLISKITDTVLSDAKVTRPHRIDPDRLPSTARSRSASYSSPGTRTACSLPANNNLTRCSASRRSVFTRSPDARGILLGAATTHSIPRLASSRARPYPVGPASYATRTGLAKPAQNPAAPPASPLIPNVCNCPVSTSRTAATIRVACTSKPTRVLAFASGWLLLCGCGPPRGWSRAA
jgi:putative transposase